MDRPGQEESKFEDFYFIGDSCHCFPLTQDLHEEMLEEFEGKQIVRFTIDMVYISEDGCSATVNWSTEVIDENSPDTNEGDEWELTRTSDGNWLISGL